MLGRKSQRLKVMYFNDATYISLKWKNDQYGERIVVAY
jgi:hypothetical protein